MLGPVELLCNMTLVLGIKTSDGFLISADSQAIEHDGSEVKEVGEYPLTASKPFLRSAFVYKYTILLH